MKRTPNMDLRNTKATGPQPTSRPCVPLAIPNIIEPRFAASFRGQESEQIAQRHLLSAGWEIVATNKKISHVQVDILARDSQGLLHIVEVKSAGSLERGLLSRRQRHRLESALLSLAQIEPVELLVIVVERANGTGKVLLFEYKDLD